MTEQPKLVVPVPAELMQAIIQYLSARPYAEVAQALNILATIRPVPAFDAPPADPVLMSERGTA